MSPLQETVVVNTAYLIVQVGLALRTQLMGVELRCSGQREVCTDYKRCFAV